MPRRLAVAKHAGGFDAVGWTLLGFLLGASLAVFALLHADIHGLSRPEATPPVSAPGGGAVVSYAPPAPPPVTRFSPPLAPPTSVAPAPALAPETRPKPSPNALASAGAASAHTAGEARARPPAAPERKAASAAQQAQVDDDAAAAGMTSRAGAQKPPDASPDLY